MTQALQPTKDQRKQNFCNKQDRIESRAWSMFILDESHMNKTGFTNKAKDFTSFIKILLLNILTCMRFKWRSLSVLYQLLSQVHTI